MCVKTLVSKMETFASIIGIDDNIPSEKEIKRYEELCMVQCEECVSQCTKECESLHIILDGVRPYQCID